MMANEYRNFAELEQSETRRDYRIRSRYRGTRTVVIAPHGGKIEPRTSEIADAIASDDLSFYSFEGTKSHGNGQLHIKSTHFDEPRCVNLVKASTRAISVHGCGGQKPVVCLGGRDSGALEVLRAALEEKRFVARIFCPGLEGREKRNICNRTMSGMGIQLELSESLRRSFFRALSKKGRRQKTRRFHDFVAAVRGSICKR